MYYGFFKPCLTEQRLIFNKSIGVQKTDIVSLNKDNKIQQHLLK